MAEKFNLYVAGKWEEREKVRILMDVFESRGYGITVDWTTHDHTDMSKKYAIEDVEGIRSCDILVAYMPNSNLFYKGAWIEIGIALGLDKKIVIVGHDVCSVFLGHPNITVVAYKEEAITFVDKEYDRYIGQSFKQKHCAGCW